MSRDRLKSAACAALLLAINVYIARELFRMEYTWHMESIAGPYIAIARYITENWRDLNWWPLWYGGIPFQNTYPPLLHLAVAAVAKAGSVSPALAYHAVCAAFYCLGPVTLFWLSLRLSGRRMYSFAGTLLYSVFSPSAVLIWGIRNDMGSAFHPRRLQALVRYGEGPHIASMTLLPLAILCLHQAFETRRRGWWMLTALAMCAVVLTNWIGGFALGAAVMAYLLSRRPAADWRNWARLAGLGVFSYVIASPWIPPSTLKAIRTNAQHIGGAYSVTLNHLKYAGLLLIAVVLLDWWFEKRKLSPHARFAAYWALLMGVITLAAEYLNVFIVPQPHRYHLEMEMAFTSGLAFAFRPIMDRLPAPRRALIVFGLLLFCGFQMKTYRGFAAWMDRPVDIKTTTEYRTAEWFRANTANRRVLAGGTTGFWLNVWTDIPQLNGGFDQGISNWHVTDALHQIYSGENAGGREGEVAVKWLRAYGVQAISVNRESLESFANPKKFEGLLKPLLKDAEGAIYEVPQRSPHPGYVIRPQDVVEPEPYNALDLAPLDRYLAAIDNPDLPVPDFQWLSRRRAAITGDFGGGRLLSLQITYHPGWRATVNGQLRRLYRDKIGQILVEPGCGGRCTVEVEYNGGIEMLLARVLSWTALAGGFAWVLLGRRRSIQV